MNDYKSCRHPRKYISPKERLSRFLFDEAHVFKNGDIKQAAFSPNKDLKYSVYRTSRSSESEIWVIKSEQVDDRRTDGKKSIGRFDILAEAFITSNLQFDPNGKPHTRHANVVGWNSNKPDDLQKRQELAKLASQAIYPTAEITR